MTFPSGFLKVKVFRKFFDYSLPTDRMWTKVLEIKNSILIIGKSAGVIQW
jgi:hypothetical protein